MKVTMADMEQIMDQIKRNPSADILETTKLLNDQLVKTRGYVELVQMTSLMLMSKSMGQKDMEISNILLEGCGVGVMAGALIGYLIGLREAGLEMGIGSSEAPEDLQK